MRILCSLLLLCALATNAAPLPPELEKQVDAVFAELSGTRTPGCALALMREEKLVFARGYGMADLEQHVAITPKSVFGIQSTSKQFIAMGIVLLIQEGRLAFDDDVRKYVPELPDYGRTITIRHLLEHTSGLRDINILTQDQGWESDLVLTRAALLRTITRQQSLNHPPGAAASYTNSGYILLTLIAERIAKEPFDAFLARRVFEPLGMRHTVFRIDPRAILPDRVRAYRRGGDGVWRIAGAERYNVFTTVEDLVQWNENFVRPKVGGAEAIRWMTTWAKLDTGQTTEWGLGLSPLRYKGLEGIYFSGGGGDGTSVFARFPAQQFALSMMCNAGLPFNAEIFAQRVLDVVLADAIAAAPKTEPPAIVDPPPVPVARETLQRFAGMYFTPHGGPFSRTFRVKDDAFVVVVSPERSVPLIHLGNGRFRASGSTTEYEFGRDRVRRFAQNEPVVELVRVDETKPSSFDELAGVFSSDEIEATVTFTVQDGKLHYAFPRQERPDPLEPVFRDAFSDGPLTFRFRRDARGRITGVTKHWDRVWALDYVRVRQ